MKECPWCHNSDFLSVQLFQVNNKTTKVFIR